MVAIIWKPGQDGYLEDSFFRCNILSESPFPPPLRDRQSPIYQITQESALPLTSSGFPQRICWFKNLKTKKVVPSVLLLGVSWIPSILRYHLFNPFPCFMKVLNILWPSPPCPGFLPEICRWKIRSLETHLRFCFSSFICSWFDRS